MQVPQGKATVPLLPAHLRCTHLPLKCPQGDRPQDEARQSGASTVEDRAASSSWGLLAPAASPYTDAATVAYITAIEIQAAVSMSKSGPSSKWNTHTHCYSFTIPLRTSTVCIYVHVLRIHCGGCDRTVLYTALFCVVWVPPSPYLTHLGFILGYTILTRTSNCLSLS